MKKSKFGTAIILLGFAPCTAFCDGEKTIARVIASHANSVSLHISDDPKRFAAPGARVFEGDRFQTIAGQSVTLKFDEQTKITVGPNSRIRIANWTSRNGDGRLVRKIFLNEGALFADVRRIYSQEEPFLVESPNGVVAVRGTRFTVESGPGRVAQVLRNQRNTDSEIQKKIDQEYALLKSEIEVHTFSGEVYFAKSESALRDSSRRVSIFAGSTSLLRLGLDAPQKPHEFDVLRFQKYAAKLIPLVSNDELAVVRTETSEKRATVALLNGSAAPVLSSGQTRAIASSVEQITRPASRRAQFLRTKAGNVADLRRDSSANALTDAFALSARKKGGASRATTR